ncbi:hypothetical protein ILUMI_03060 [Ignelater luminosus]|uniref:UDP-glucuronosyltransferase n=1 Tax=Ignelater luminosus TaxID=2038154 RepID=A0A8K0DFA5_IGNLU|nr:hypothetical protein ILUMI_03060 [Ignelater luminosus]
MLTVILFTTIISQSFSARILGIASAPCYSHQVVFQTLWKELSLRGHQLTVLTTYPLNDPHLVNLTEIDLHSTGEAWKRVNMFDVLTRGMQYAFNIGWNISNQLMHEQLSNAQVQELIKNNNEIFDLLIVEATFPTMYAFSVRYNCPAIAISSLDAPSRNLDIMGNPSHPVLNPYFLLPFSGKLNFWERLVSSAFSIYMRYFNSYHFFPMQEEIMKNYFGNDYPSVKDITKNITLLFTNTNPILHEVRPQLPSIISIGGGIHLKSSEELPKNLATYLDDAQGGFIYFSLGTSVASNNLPKSVLNVILETFRELPYTVVWKYEDKYLPEKSENVLISKWFPQQAVLRHPNIKLFITQGGLQSLEEAIYNHVPIIGVPVMGDQHQNIKKIVNKGLGLQIDLLSLEKKAFKNAILEVISNPKYRQNIQDLAKIALDQPMTALERAVWWTEYVLRNNGAKHLRSPAVDLPTYQYVGFAFSTNFSKTSTLQTEEELSTLKVYSKQDQNITVSVL